LIRKYRVRVAIFLVCVALLLGILGTAYKAVNTIYVLNAVERERDGWQRPSDVVAALGLNEGGTVADIGSGAGYFTLKLARAAGPRGRAFAVDLRRLPLFFLRVRALSGGLRNVETIAGDSRDPRLPAGALDAVLIANTYHEFADPEAMLGHAFRSLRPNGRLVVLDRSPAGDGGGDHHGISPATVDAQVRSRGFRVVVRNDGFIDRPGERWWLLVARRD